MRRMLPLLRLTSWASVVGGIALGLLALLIAPFDPGFAIDEALEGAIRVSGAGIFVGGVLYLLLSIDDRLRLLGERNR
ncbi:MAG: hypothetical protein M3M95_07860 [Pseudomonadota bacterium]|nr:hypothetical protein [Pseudomonadota bacterium]